jgi:hypothetical protein
MQRGHSYASYWLAVHNDLNALAMHLGHIGGLEVQEWLVLNIRPAWFLLQARPNLVLISSAPNGWADVFAPDDSQYDRYGYNVTEDRWAYNIEPRDADRIKKAVSTFTKKRRR